MQGKELFELSERSLMDHVTLVSHNSYLFKGTVRDNLKMGKADATEEEMLLATIAMIGSFGPVVALSNLSNNLSQTLASGERVLSLLEEEPILKEFFMEIPKGKAVGIHGRSGSGKSTLLKLLMRFWDADSGNVRISGKDIGEINTGDLRNMESFVTQETCLFHDSIANNIAVGKPDASRKEIEEAAKKASIHDFIMTLEKGYDTPAIWML